MKKFIITLITLLLIVGAALGGAYIYRTKRKNSDPVKVYPVSNFVGNWYESSSSFSGNVVVSNEQNIYIEKDKLVKGIYASPGDSVKAGDVILEYDTTQESLKLDTMYAQLQVSYTDLRLAENQLEKLNNTTPIEDDAEIPKTPAEKKLEEAEKAYDEASEKTIAPLTEYNEAQKTVLELKDEMDTKQKEYDRSVIDRDKAYKDLDAFYKKNNIATCTDAVPEKIARTDEEIKNDVYKLDKTVVSEYGGVYQLFKTADSTCIQKYNALSEITEKLEKATSDCNEKQKKYEQAMDVANKAEAEVDKALEELKKEQDEQLENPEIVYTKTELARAIRLKNEEIRNLNLRIQNQNLSIKRQEKAIEKCKVLAEFDGVVRFNEVTDDVYSGMSPAIVIDASDVYSAVINVDELSLDEIYIGEQVDILSYDTGMSYTGKVSKIAENPSESGGYYEYTASSYPVSVVIDGGEDLSEGMWVEVTTAQTSNYESLQNEIVIPLALCKKENASYYVMKRENGRLKKQVISTGKIYYGTEIVVKAGITASDYIAFPYEKDAVEGKVCKEADLSDLYGY
jgi:multidrug efflux pump subunit AcrA (membrane-fusion protein)